MNIIGYNKNGAIRIIFDGSDIESIVPDDLSNRDRQLIAEWEAAGNVIPPYEEEDLLPAIAAPSAYTLTTLKIENGEVTTIHGSGGFAGAFPISENQIYVIFAMEITEPYSIFFDCGGSHCYVNPEEKDQYGFIVNSQDLQGNAALPACMTIFVMRM